MTRLFWTALVALMALLLSDGANAAADPCLSGPCVVAYGGGRIAVDVDGNFNDPDDWAATPVILALIARRGLQSRLVHFDYNNSLGPNLADMASQMRTSALSGAQKFGFSTSRFFDCQSALSSAIASLQAQINASSATDPLFVIAAGPMEVLWRALNGSDASKRQYVTVISHSPWNDNRVAPPDMTHTASDVQALGVKWIEITDQNGRLYTGSDNAPWPHTYTGTDYTPWAWLKDASDDRMRWIYQRMLDEGKPDISDAGMVYFLLKNDPYGTPDKLRQFFGDWVTPVSAPPSNSVTSLSLMNADTNKPIPGYDPLPNNAKLDLASLPTRNLNIRANTDPSTVGSVQFGLDGNSNYTTETQAPYSLAGDSSGNYTAWTPSVGSHSVTATPYSGAGATGSAGDALTLAFTVTDSTPPAVTQTVTSLSLIDADTNKPIAGYDPLTNGAKLDLASLPTRHLNIRANTDPSSVGSVRFGLDSNSGYATDNAAPYALAGDSSGNFSAWTPSIGSHSVKATPYTGSNASGTPGDASTVAFTVTDSTPPSAPQAVTSLSLINADTNKPIPGYDPLPSGTTLDLATLPTQHLNIRANTDPSTVGSVQFALDGNLGTDDSAPYALAGDSSGNYPAWTPPIGRHSLTATPYTGSKASGTAGKAITVAFSVMDSTPPSAAQAVTSLSLINADTNKPISGYDPIRNREKLDLASLPTRHLNIRANTDPSTVGSVQFGLDGNSGYATDGSAPYALGGDSSGNYTAWTPSVGSHSLTATPYSDANGKGTAGTSLTLAFTVSDSGGSSQPQAVTSLTLINADTNKPISGYDPLPSGTTLDLATLPTRHLNIRANTDPSTVGSVEFALDRASGTDNSAPYALAGDSSGNYAAWTPSVGRHSLTATPYTGSKASGTPGDPTTVAFTVTNSTPPSVTEAVTSLSLINADTNKPISGYDPIRNGTTLDLASLPTRHLNIRANTDPATVGSVRFALDRDSGIDNSAPYALAGDSSGNYAAWTPSVGRHSLTATPYTGSKASGTPGDPTTVAFTVTDSTPPSVTEAVTSLSLINADTNKPISGYDPIRNGTTLDLASLPTRHLNIRANTDPATVGSVRFALDRDSGIDNSAPYALAGDSSGNYAAWTPSVGRHSLTATPYTGSKASGTPGDPTTVAFTVTDSTPPSVTEAVTSLSLINADTNKPISGYDPIRNGTTLDLASLPTRHLNIRANTDPATVGSVRFALDRDSGIDDSAPYALAGDSSGNYAAWTPSVGRHSLTATPYTGSKASGTPGDPTTVAFTVTDSTPPSVTEAVTSLSLINADTNKPISGYDPMRNGTTLDLASLPTRHLNIRANTDPATVGSVRFGLDGKSNYATDDAAPYALERRQLRQLHGLDAVPGRPQRDGNALRGKWRQGQRGDLPHPRLHRYQLDTTQRHPDGELVDADQRRHRQAHLRLRSHPERRHARPGEAAFPQPRHSCEHEPLDGRQRPVRPRPQELLHDRGCGALCAGRGQLRRRHGLDALPREPQREGHALLGLESIRHRRCAPERHLHRDGLGWLGR